MVLRHPASFSWLSGRSAGTASASRALPAWLSLSGVSSRVPSTSQTKRPLCPKDELIGLLQQLLQPSSN